MHIGKPGEGLDRHVAERAGVADLAKHLAGASAIVRRGAVHEAGKQDRAAGADRAPGNGGARTKVERAKVRARIGSQMRRIDVGRACARTRADARIGVAAGNTRPPIVAEPAVDAGEEARQVALYVGRIAGAETL